MNQVYKLINGELKKIETELINKYNIKLEKIKEIQYGINFNVYVNGKNMKTMAIYYKPKKKIFTFVSNVVEKETVLLIEEIFNKRDFIHINDNKDKSQEIYLKDKVKYYYNILEKYKNEDFDFIDLAEAINDYYIFKEIENNILRFNLDFSTLEKFYLEIKGDNNEY